jgi:hypothetical protein
MHMRAAIVASEVLLALAYQVVRREML